MYRPPDWKGYHCGKSCVKCDTNPVDCNKHYEVGANAMYNALWKLAEESPTKTFTLDANVIEM